MCACAAGFGGLFCSEDINDCEIDPCFNGATCVDLVNDFVCECLPEFSGPNCEVQVVFCSLEACENGGTCIEEVDGFSCSCPDGFTGNACEIDIDLCDGTLCQNGATCIDFIGDGFTCVCAPGFTDAFCNTTIDFCASGPCSENSECVSMVNGFECECNAGFTGELCETDINECVPNPCFNGATCMEGIDHFVCICAQGFTGSFCEVNIDDCNSSPCENGATCIDGTAQFTCECADGFSGETCATQVDFCLDSPCFNGATCLSVSGAFQCACPLGWFGDRCQFAEDIAVKLNSCGLPDAFDVFNVSGVAEGNETVFINSGSPTISANFVGDFTDLYWSAWVWQEYGTSPVAVFSIEDSSGFGLTSLTLVSDLQTQQLVLFYSAPQFLGSSIDATFTGVPLLANDWHHLALVAFSNGTVVLSVDGSYLQSRELEGIDLSDEEQPLGSSVLTLPRQFSLILGVSSVLNPSSAGPFTGLMRAVALSGVDSDFEPLPLEYCVLECVAGEGSCASATGQCLDLIGADRRCVCAYGYTGPFCQYLHSRLSFESSGYAQFSNTPLDITSLAFDFKTDVPTAQLSYHTRPQHRLSFELRSGNLELDLTDCQSENTNFAVSSPALLNDTQWHTVNAEGGLTVQLDDNQPDTFDVALPNCTNPLPRVTFFGGALNASNSFRGCMRELSFNAEPIDFTSLQLSDGAEFGCTRDTVQFFGFSTIELSEFISRESQTISFDFNTLYNDGIIYYSRRIPTESTGSNPNDFVAVHIQEARVTFQFNLGEQDRDVILQSPTALNDGNWHRVIAWQNETMATLTVDGDTQLGTASGPLAQLDTTGSVFLGGVPVGSQIAGFDGFSPFAGCVRDLEQNGVAVDLQESIAAQNVRFGSCN